MPSWALVRIVCVRWGGGVRPGVETGPDGGVAGSGDVVKDDPGDEESTVGDAAAGGVGMGRTSGRDGLGGAAWYSGDSGSGIEQPRINQRGCREVVCLKPGKVDSTNTTCLDR
ncbi:unnamed protein product [Linum trigynum]|uniref:Uncharacterized protein n=1 Tax=Linum trigynum TaxID=586398 RepID=A0AAV2GC00_9ROSI